MTLSRTDPFTEIAWHPRPLSAPSAPLREKWVFPAFGRPLPHPSVLIRVIRGQNVRVFRVVRGSRPSLRPLRLCAIISSPLWPSRDSPLCPGGPSFIRPSPRGGRSGIRPRLVQTAVSVVVHPGGMAGRRRLGRETKRAARVFISARPIQVTRPRLRPSARGSWKWRACIAPVQRIRGRRSSSGSGCP